MNTQTLFLLPFGLLMLAGLIAWLLGKRVPTRILGVIGAIFVFASFVSLLLTSRRADLPIMLGERAWLSAYGVAPQPVSQATLMLQLDNLSLLFANILLVGSTLGILFLAQSLGSSLIGYGRLWSSILLMVGGVLLGILAGDLILLAFGWGLAILGSLLARQIVNHDQQSAPSIFLLAGTSGFMLVLAFVMWSVRPEDPTTGSFLLRDIGVNVRFGAWLPLIIAVAIGLGLPPFSRMLNNAENTTPALHSLIVSCGLPLLAIYTLLRMFGLNLGSWSPNWLVFLQILGFIEIIASGAYALRVRQFGALLGWQAVVQWSGVIAVLGTYNPKNGLGTPANLVVLASVLMLVIATVGSTLLAGFALGWLEQRSGSDIIDQQPVLGQAQRVAGVAYLLAAATAVGFPPLPGYWARRWMLDSGQPTGWLMASWAIGGVLLAMSYLAPLALFWRSEAKPQRTPPFRSNALILMITGLGLVVLGFLPEVFLRISLLPAVQTLQPVAMPYGLVGTASLAWRIIFGVFGVFILFLAARSGIKPHLPAWTAGELLDRDAHTAHAPQALSTSLIPLSSLAYSRELAQLFARAIQRLSQRVGWLLQIFSGRYYLTGILIAVATVILLLL